MFKVGIGGGRVIDVEEFIFRGEGSRRKRFRWFDLFRTKAMAQRKAKRLRANNVLVRIIKTDKAYSVYTHAQGHGIGRAFRK